MKCECGIHIGEQPPVLFSGGIRIGCDYGCYGFCNVGL